MTVAYLDTSALAKLYVQEEGDERVMAVIEKTQAVVTSVITYTEVRAVFARRLRDGEVTEDEHMQMVTRFDEDWEGVNEVDVTPRVYRLAGSLVVAHPRLRAMDALHMASALEAKSQTELLFLTFDADLEAVAKSLLGKQAIL